MILIDTNWYLMALGQYMVILAGTWWCWVIISWYCSVLGRGQYRALPVYIGKKVEIWSGVTDPSQTHSPRDGVLFIICNRVDALQ